MSNIADAISRDYVIYATLANDHGDAVPLGPAVEVRKKNRGYWFKFRISDADNISPLDRVILHTKRGVIGGQYIKPIILGDEATVQFDYVS
jgi:hypothetical protein